MYTVQGVNQLLIENCEDVKTTTKKNCKDYSALIAIQLCNTLKIN